MTEKHRVQWVCEMWASISHISVMAQKQGSRVWGLKGATPEVVVRPRAGHGSGMSTVSRNTYFSKEQENKSLKVGVGNSKNSWPLYFQLRVRGYRWRQTSSVLEGLEANGTPREAVWEGRGPREGSNQRTHRQRGTGHSRWGAALRVAQLAKNSRWQVTLGAHLAMAQEGKR